MWGSTSAGLLFPETILPEKYTLFHVTRYSGLGEDKQGRIIQGATKNWLSGFWSRLNGVAHHQAWMTQFAKAEHGIHEWVLSTDQNALYRSNGVKRSDGNFGGTGHDQLAISNSGIHGKTETSDFQIAEIIVYNRNLTEEEYKKVEGFLAHKYDLAMKAEFANPIQDIADVEAAAAAEKQAENDKAAADKEAKEAEVAKKAEEAAASTICFPETAMVNNKPITELKIGDIVPTSTGISKVTTFLHYEPNINVNMIRLILENDKKTIVSKDHLIYSNGEYKSVVSVEIGDFVEYKGELVKIVEKSVIEAKGLYAPLTEEGNIIVDDIHYSCYTQTDWTRHIDNYQEVVNSVVQPISKFLRESNIEIYEVARFCEGILIC